MGSQVTKIPVEDDGFVGQTIVGQSVLKAEIRAASVYAERHEKQLTELADRFDNMGNLGLFWDSKVPEKDKSFFYFMTFRLTDMEDVKAEIDKYLKFYRDLSELTSKIGSDGSDDSEESRLIQDLRKNLTEMRRAAEAGEETTGSSAVYNLHCEFVAKHEKLEHIIKRIECAAVSERKNQWVERSNQLKRDLEKSEDRFNTVCEKLDQLVIQQQEAIEGNRVLGQENDSLRMQNQQLSETNNNWERQLETLQQNNERQEREIQEMREQQQELLNTNKMILNLLRKINQQESNSLR